MPASVQLNGATITGVTISRPSWNSVATAAVPTARGQDRRHVVAWWVMREHITANLVGGTLSDAQSYLSGCGITTGGSSRAQIEWGIWELAKSLFNQVDNLWPGAASPNRFLGSHIVQADNLVQQRDTLTYPVMIEVDVPDENGGSSRARIPLNDEDQVIDWLFNMAVDWQSALDVTQAAASFEQFLQSKGI